MSYKRNRKAEKEAAKQAFEEMLGKMRKVADSIVETMEPDRVKHLCACFLTVALGAYHVEKEDSDLLELFDSILSQVNIHVRYVDGKEESHD